MACKTVLKPLKVPDGAFCWEHSGPGRGPVCKHFDNEFALNKCTAGFWIETKELDVNGGYLKPVECLNLKEAE